MAVYIDILWKNNSLCGTMVKPRMFCGQIFFFLSRCSKTLFTALAFKIKLFLIFFPATPFPLWAHGFIMHNHHSCSLYDALHLVWNSPPPNSWFRDDVLFSTYSISIRKISQSPEKMAKWSPSTTFGGTKIILKGSHREGSWETIKTISLICRGIAPKGKRQGK